MSNKRIFSIDTLRVFAIFGVILIHTHTFYWEGTNFTGLAGVLSWVLRRISYLGVPFFFTVSGYFFGKSFLKEKNVTKIYSKYIKRLLIIFIGWSLIYSLPHFSAKVWQSIQQYGWMRTYFWHIQNYSYRPFLLIMSGTSGHLWFIMALMQSLTFISLFVFFNQQKPLLYFALLLYILAPYVNLYMIPPAGPDGYTWNPMIGPFISTLPVVAGWWLANQKKYDLFLAILLFLSGFALMLISGKFITHFYHINPGHGDFSLVLIPLSIVMFALLNPSLGEKTIFPILGQFTLGIYCAQMLVINYLDILGRSVNPYWWDIIIPMLTYLVSLLVTLALQSNPLTRKLVT
jgi:surface polysaccharide O-acyltransferase-like enzyme